ncbi:Gfo/Idh/MocA family protein [Metabacillus sediminilitoris]|uniref:Gfo/Idh/MocA family oxidoreductase n=1 Tax=Metabacillus sediminilitoris TaxID=2567941 RepID=A0A4S4BY82_9BACI|nr:Gfo/Idh/MocA family oxidoreductase [Metabacillus sediminilitoris]QGQ44486.1 oxidoreductase [Metabacillus sediminilitoris]THF80109.1 Gfo/Idh/MocA family oxidoreductase [Metabacillus sediminilitoris]
MIRFGIIGTNWITERLIKAASKVEGFSLTAVYSRTNEKAEEFAAKFTSIKHIYTDLTEFASSQEFDAVYIASPNSLHASQAILCMQNGKHVLCEKPIASNTKEIIEMVKVANEHSVVLMEALKVTLVPNFDTIKENLHKIGKVRRYFASYCQYSSRYDKYKEGIVLNAFNPAFSNGALMDIGIYCVYPAVALFGEPKQVQATSYMLESGVDGEGSILLTYDDMDAVIMYSKITNSYVPSEIQGENGSIIFDKINTPEKVKIHYKDGTVEDISRPQDSDDMYYEVKEFVEVVTNKKDQSEVNSHQNTLITAKILEDSRKQIGLVYPADK